MKALFESTPRYHWGANENLIFTVYKKGKPQTFAIDPESNTLKRITDGKPAPGADGKPRVVAQGMFSYSPPIREISSPDDKWFAGTDDGNLYFRPTSRDGKETPFTKDSTPDDDYTVLGARWSPDNRYLALRRMDSRGVPTIPLVNWSSADQTVKPWLYSRVGDPIVRQTLVIADRHTGTLSTIKLDPSLAYLHLVSWSPGSRYLYLMATSRLMKRLDLVRIEASTGKADILLSEHSKTNIDGSQSYLFVRGYAPQLTQLHYVTMLPDGRFIWTSERDGWRRLYLYSANGALVRPLTPTHSVVRRVIGYDAADGTVYYIARAETDRPYRNALFGVSIKDGKAKQVASGPRFFHVLMRPDGRYFAFVHGGLHDPTRLDIYSNDGHRIRRVWSGRHATSRFRHGAIDPFTAKAADGKTLIHGLLFKPAGFDAGKKYPVVEIIYAGPQDGIVAHWQGSANYWAGQALASAGFVAVEIDARGTPGRGRAFANAFYGHIGQGEIADHVAALRQVSAARPWMDMRRVGIFGHSWGGYFAARALLKAPELYKAAAASAGPASLRDFRVPIEPYMGCLPKLCPTVYGQGSNVALVPHMTGNLMILQGTADRDVPFGNSMRLISALVKAGKPYQFVAFPGQPHTIYYSSYWWHRIIGFFKQNLGAAR